MINCALTQVTLYFYSLLFSANTTTVKLQVLASKAFDMLVITGKCYQSAGLCQQVKQFFLVFNHYFFGHSFIIKSLQFYI